MENLETDLTDAVIANSPDAVTYMRNIYMMRRMNFIRLVDDRKMRATVAYRMGIKGVSWFSQLLNDDVAFNEKTARRIEVAMGLKFGALDKRSW